jgi:hypothetical protein
MSPHFIEKIPFHFFCILPQVIDAPGWDFLSSRFLPYFGWIRTGNWINSLSQQLIQRKGISTIYTNFSL